MAVIRPPDHADDTFREAAMGLRQVLGPDRLRLAASFRHDGCDERRMTNLRHLAEHLRLELIATNDVLHLEPARKMMADVLTCIHEHCTLDEAGLRLAANAERHLKPPAEMHRLFASMPGAIDPPGQPLAAKSRDFHRGAGEGSPQRTRRVGRRGGKERKQENRKAGKHESRQSGALHEFAVYFFA